MNKYEQWKLRRDAARVAKPKILDLGSKLVDVDVDFGDISIMDGDGRELVSLTPEQARCLSSWLADLFSDAVIVNTDAGGSAGSSGQVSATNAYKSVYPSASVDRPHQLAELIGTSIGTGRY